MDGMMGRGSYPLNLVDLLLARSSSSPDLPVQTFLTDGERAENTLTAVQLDHRARVIGAALQRAHLAGRTVLLLYPPGLDFVEAFFGCLYAGAIAVPAYPPKANRSFGRLRAILRDAGAAAVLSVDALLGDIRQRLQEGDARSVSLWLATDALPEAVDDWRQPDLVPDSLAFLQYTSGSTGDPKGVMVSHGNLLHNSECLKHAIGLNADSVGVCWLPSFHDMGLITGVIAPVYSGFRHYIMAPVAFLQKPIRWLEAISRLRATFSGGPNSAYELCLRAIPPEQSRDLDLRCWTAAFNGAEPIRAETLRRFAEIFAPSGFSARSWLPGYGMAEATLMVSCGPPRSGATLLYARSGDLKRHCVVPEVADASDVAALVGCGQKALDTEVAVVDPETCVRCGPGVIGELWVRGPSVAQGYWNRIEQTAATFDARIAGTEDGSFLRTGDLGYVDHDQVFVTGRLKDLIIVRGRNFYPQDIEVTVEQSHPVLAPGTAAAFPVEAGREERLVVAVEVQRQHRRTIRPDEVFAAVRRAVAEEHDLQIHGIVLLQPSSVPKTSSGKIQRRPCREAFLKGELDTIAAWMAPLEDTNSFEQAAPTSPLRSGKCSEQRSRGSRSEKKGLASGERRRSDVSADPGHSVAADNAAKVPQRNESCTPANGAGVAPGTAAVTQSAAALEHWLRTQVARRIGVTPEQVDVTQPFAAFGFGSLEAVDLAGQLERHLGQPIPGTLVYDQPSISAVVSWLTHRPDVVSIAETGPASSGNDPIAIVGLGCRFPGADSPDRFWTILREGRDCIRRVPAGRFGAAAADDPRLAWGGFLDGVDQFDADFFGLAPREVAHMDPQQRLLLEVAWETLESAGCDPRSLGGSTTGVFVGISGSDYLRLLTSQVRDLDAYVGTGNAGSIAANRVSYFLDLRGPSIAVDTACSSSLMAVHLACRSLRAGECCAALAGGVNLILSPEISRVFAEAGMLAGDGRCKTFAAGADGYVRGEGCGLVLLKRLSDAMAAGDRVLAIVRGTAVNQDGRSNGLTAPNGPAQEAVIRAALADASVDPADIDYVEAHGTGTELGDPIEVQALGRVLCPARSAGRRLRIGSVKTNIGHLEAAAGIAGLIKVVLSLQAGEIPPHLHLDRPNPLIPWANLPIDPVTGLAHWTLAGRTRLAGVSSFGFGGTNAHVILEEPPAAAAMASSSERLTHLLTLSARDEQGLARRAAELKDRLVSDASLSLADVCFTSAAGRAHFPHRAAIVVSNRQEAIAGLTSIAGREVRGEPPKVAFLFTGQGSQYVGMGRRLFDTQPIFRQAMLRCDTVLRECHGWSLTDLLYGRSAAMAAPVSGAALSPPSTVLSPDSSPLDRTLYAQPALFAWSGR